MKLKKCTSCKEYTLKNNCSKCNKKTSSAHYKFIKIKSIKKD
ncbi:MAG: nucleolar RNA-binding Nop10p family protein [Nanoarchaeota archaeon]